MNSTNTELWRDTLVQFLAAFYQAPAWKDATGKVAWHDFFERRVQVCVGKNNFRQLADELSRKLGLSRLPVEADLIDKLDAFGREPVVQLRRETRYWVALGVADATAQMKARKAKRDDGQTD